MGETQESRGKGDPKPVPLTPREGNSFGWVLWALFFLFVAYPLSIGPAARFHKACPPARPMIETAYAPITTVMEHCRPVRDAFYWYVSKVWKVD